MTNYFEVGDRVMVIDQYPRYFGEYGTVLEVLDDYKICVGMRDGSNIYVNKSSIELAPTKQEQLKRKIIKELQKQDLNNFEYEYDNDRRGFKRKFSIFTEYICILDSSNKVVFSSRVPVNIGKMIFEFYEGIVE